MARRVPGSSAVPRLPAGTRLAAVVSTYHAEVTDTMLASAREALGRAGLSEGDWLAVRVPGTFELPVVAQRLARRADVHAVLCFGLVLKGETDHDRHIARSVAHALQSVALSSGKPVLFGVLTCATLEQARHRARRLEQGGLDKGREVALAAVETLAALQSAGSGERAAAERPEEAP